MLGHSCTGLDPSPETTGRRADLVLSWLGPLTALLVFWPALAGGLVYDDWVNFDRNPALRDRDWLALLTRPYFGADTTYWRPITSVLMGLAYPWGLMGVHLLALGTHVVATRTLGAIARLILGDPLLAAFAALLFALHPLQVESVAWGSALPGVLSGMFVLRAVGTALSWALRNEGRWPWDIPVWLVCALLAKESAVAAVPVLAFVALLGSRPLAAKLTACLVPAIVAGAWFALHVAMVGWRPMFGDGGDWVSGAAQMTVRQAVLLVVPWPLTPFRTHPNAIGDDASDSVALLVAAVLVAATLVTLASKRTTRHWRVALALLAAPLLLSSALYAGVGPHPLTDRYLYVAVSGFALAVVACVGRRPVMLGALAATYGAASFGQCSVWRNDASFAAHVAAVSSGEPCVHVLAGMQALRVDDPGRLARARAAFARALAISPPWLDDFARRQRAAAITGLAWCDFEDPDERAALPAGATQGLPFGAGSRTGRPQGAAVTSDGDDSGREGIGETAGQAQIRDGGRSGQDLLPRFRAAIAENARYVPAWVGVGVALGERGRFAEAVDALHVALSIDPRCPEAWFNLAHTQLDMGHVEQARQSLRRAIDCDPQLEPARRLLARLTEER